MVTQRNWQHYWLHKTQDEENKTKNVTQTTTTMSNTDPTKNWEWTQTPAKGKKILPLIRHPPYYSYSQYVLKTTIGKQTQLT